MIWEAKVRCRQTFLIAVIAMSLLASCAAESEQERIDQADFHYKLANGYFYENQIVMALRELTQSLELNPDHPDAHHLMGFVFFGRKEYATAERHFRKALTLRGGFHEARSNLAAVLMATRRWAEAITVLDPLLSETLYATPWVAHNNVAYCHAKLEHSSEALRHYRLAIMHNPEFCLGYNNLGALYQTLGQADLAIEYLERATARCGQYPEPHFHLGEIYAAMGELEQSRSAFRSCYQAAPQTPYGRRCRRRM